MKSIRKMFLLHSLLARFSLNEQRMKQFTEQDSHPQRHLMAFAIKNEMWFIIIIIEKLFKRQPHPSNIPLLTPIYAIFNGKCNKKLLTTPSLPETLERDIKACRNFYGKFTSFLSHSHSHLPGSIITEKSFLDEFNMVPLICRTYEDPKRLNPI